jgi:Xaa-Pro dipeptidase
MSAAVFPSESFFTAAEYERRLARVRARMAGRGLDAFVAFGPANLYYLTGFSAVVTPDFECCVVPASGRPHLVLGGFLRGRFLASSWLDEATFYGPGDDPIAALAGLVGDLGLQDRTIGVDEASHGLPVATHRRIASALPEARLADGGGIVEAVRLVKSDEELACMRRAAEVTRRGVAAALAAARPGAYDHDLAAAAYAAAQAAGGDVMAREPIIAAGYRSGLAHSPVGHYRLQEGDPLFVEMAGNVRRYNVPVMRTAVVGGDTPPEHAELLDAARETAAAVTAAARPGVPAGEVARAGMGPIGRVESRVAFHYNFGYSIGLGFPPHWLEDFFLKLDNPTPLEAGMTFHLPLTLRVLGRYGAGTSASILVTGRGGETLIAGWEI